MKTLLIGEIHPEAQRRLKENTVLKQISNEEFNQQKSFLGVRAIVLRTFTKLNQEALDKLPDLKYVVCCSVGTDHLDLAELAQRKIELICCPGTNANSVAEHTLYLLLSLLREDQKIPFFELKNKTVGMIGFGNIGQRVAQKLGGFGVQIIAFDVIEPAPSTLKELQTEMKSFEETLQEADIISLHLPLNKATEKLIDGEAFQKMKEGAFLINTSRAGVIDEEALLKYAGKLRGLALDVYSEELKTRLKHPHLILTEHLAARGEDSYREMCLRPVEEFLKRIQS